QGPNRLTVRVYDAQDHSRQPVGKQHRWYTRTSGIWQTVYLEPRGATYIKRVHITPDVDAQQARVEVEVGGPGEAAGLQVTVIAPDGGESQHEIPGLEGTVPIPDAALWEPELPNLYEVSVALLGSGGGRKAAEPLDVVETYFGMRKVERRKLAGADCEYVWLNDHPVYLRGALDQSFNPWGIYTFPTDEMVRSDIERAKEFGFNFLRLHIKIDEPRLLYWADKLGVLLMCDLPNWGYDGLSPEAQERWIRMLRATIERDYNHPSIFSWCLFNETWGLGGEDYKEDRETQEWVKGVYELTKELDGTRLVEDNSACRHDHVVTDINSWHFYINDYAKARTRIREVVEKTFEGSEFNYVPGRRQGTEPMMNSEYGGIGARMGDRDVSWCFRFLTNELRLHEKMCGYVYTEHMDIEWEYNGFMNYDRTVKDFGYDVRDINAADFIAIDHPPGKVYAPGERFRVELFSSHFSQESVRDAVLKWRVEIVGPDGESAIPEQGEESIAFPQYRVERAATVEFDVPEQRGLAHFVVAVEDGGGRGLARNCVAFEIYPGGLPPAEELEPGRWILRFHPASCTRADWDVEATPTGADDGHGEIVAGRAVGAFEYALQLPEQLGQGEVRDIGVCAELSAARPGAPQTDPDKHPSEVTVSVNGVAIATEVLENDPCDARGALSYIHGLSGEYGYLIGASTRRQTPEVLRSGGSTGIVVVRFEVKEDARHRGGLSIYGSRAGRYPTDPCVIIEMGAE
ncbi:MAG: glycoside hydrolase family 2 protein, partial [Armatimonadota bacterium]